MSERAPNTYYDGFAAVDGGINADRNRSVKSRSNPNGPDRNQLSFAVNCTMRGGQGVTHRPPYMRKVLVFDDVETAFAFENGLFQGAFAYQSTQSSLLASIGGRLFQIRVEQGFIVSDISIDGDLNPSNIDYAWFVQAGPFGVIQDGSSKPLIFDGTSLRRATKDEIKPGGCMAFSQGRIWYAVRNQRDGRFTMFRATDLINGPGGTAQYQRQDSVLKETENTYLNEGGEFTARTDMGEIRAMIVPRMLDTSLGQGPLQVMCEHGAMSVNAPIDRDQWKNVTYPIATESQENYGALAQSSTVNVNGDIFFRSLDGIRSFKLARADFATWLNTPVSMEVDPILQEDVEPYLFYGSAVLFDNRLLTTVWPRPTSTGFVHDGLVSLDFNLVSTMRERKPPAWEGVWTGIGVQRVVKGIFGGVERCFAFARNIQGRTELWELLPSKTDEIWDDARTPIVWSFETPAYDFDSGENLKRLMTAAIWKSDLRETVEFVMQYRPDRYPCYVDWWAWSECAPVKQCSVPRCGVPKNLRPQYRTKVRLPQPQDTPNETVNGLFRDFYECAYRVQVTGHCVINKVRYAAMDRPEHYFDGAPLVGPCKELDCCSPDPLEYSTAPFEDGGSSGGYPNYPIVAYPPPPHEYPYEYPTCDDCGVTNPPEPPPPSEPPPPDDPEPPPPPPPPPQYPGLPPVVLLPDPNAPALNGGNLFFGSWTDPGPTGVNGNTHEIGTPLMPPDGLQDGTLEAWAGDMWSQFSAYVVANNLNVVAAQIQAVYVGNNVGGGATYRWFADIYYQSDLYFGAWGLAWILQIDYQLG